MADIINRDDYVTIASSISNAVAPLASVADYYLDAAQAVLLADEFDVELDLLRPFHNAYLSAASIYTSTPNSAIEAVRALQEHVVKRSTEADVVLWCNAQEPPITVANLGVSFCTVSTAAGYPLRQSDGLTTYIAES
jgi:homoserine trans-succinylase